MVDETYSGLVAVTPEPIVVVLREKLDMYHFLDGLMWTFRITVDGGSMATDGFNNDLIVKI